MDKKIVKGVDRFIFDSIFEFNKYHLGIKPKKWRDSSVKEGDWIETDEGGITQCLKLYKLKVGKKTVQCVTTICGTVRQDMATHRLDNTIKKVHARFISKGKKKKKLKKANKEMAQAMLLGMNREEAYLKSHPNVKGKVYIKQEISRIVNAKVFQNYMDKKFSEILSDSKLTEKWALDILKNTAENKKTSGAVVKDIAIAVLEFHGRVGKVKEIEKHQWHASHIISDKEVEDVKEIGETKTKTKDKLEVQD